jgi:hypothetical protein
MASLRLATAALALGIARVAAAQDPFEIQVYEYQTVPRGRWNLETHLNHVARGERLAVGGVAPSHGQTHLTFELTRGLTSHVELAGYLVAARRADGTAELAGWRVRPRVRFPEGWLPVKVSLSAEVAFPKRVYEEESMTLEVRPILERSFGPVQVDLNPVVGKSLRGPSAAETWDFEPGARIGFAATPAVDLSLEYYGSTGPLDRPAPAREQVHQFFPGADIQLSEAVVWNVGVGFGATGAGNTRVYKMRLGWMF